MRRALSVALIAGAACARSPEPTFFALAPHSGASVPAAARTVELQRPIVAGYLDRLEIVGAVVGYRLRIRSGDSWGEPLSDMMGRVLAEDLDQRLAGAGVFLEGGPIEAEPDARVAVAVQRFDTAADGRVMLVAQVVVERNAEGAAEPVRASRTFQLGARPAGSGTAQQVAAMSELLGQLADRISVMLRA